MSKKRRGTRHRVPRLFTYVLVEKFLEEALAPFTAVAVAVTVARVTVAVTIMRVATVAVR